MWRAAGVCPLIPGSVGETLFQGFLQDAQSLSSSRFPVHTCQEPDLHPPPLGRVPCRTGGSSSARGGLWVPAVPGLHSDKGAAFKLRPPASASTKGFLANSCFCKGQSLVKCLLESQRFTFGGVGNGERLSPGARRKDGPPAWTHKMGPVHAGATLTAKPQADTMQHTALPTMHWPSSVTHRHAHSPPRPREPGPARGRPGADPFGPALT